MANQLYGKVYFNNKLKIILNIFFYWLLLILLGFYFANNTLYLDKVGGVSLSILVFVFGAFDLKSLFILIRK
ncbi:MAG: hypothetical protein IKP71_01520, partial [Candidatus Riflebacteria bacterium]|nr:hypothetical protein [Candidatus Riflebacteria bacterium]